MLSEERLQDFKIALEEERRELLEDLVNSNENISSIDSINKSGDLVDQAYNFYEKEMLIGLSTSEKETLQKINNALRKIDAKEYGTCEECGKPIEEKRLEAIPYAMRCIECKKKSAKKLKSRA